MNHSWLFRKREASCEKKLLGKSEQEIKEKNEFMKHGKNQ